MLRQAYYFIKNHQRNVVNLMSLHVMPHNKGNKLLRACGTNFVSHKVAALERFIVQYRAYLAHLTYL